MYTSDDAPARVVATPAAAAHLRDLAAQTGTVTVLLSDGRAHVLPPGQPAPRGAVRLGHLDTQVTVAGDPAARTPWWRNRATIDLTARRHALTMDLRELSEPELYAAVASGPLPRY